MDNIIHLSCNLICSPETAFEMFTRNLLLEKWLTVQADVEPQVGGKYELFWEPENKENNSTIGCRITALQKNKFLSFEWGSPKQFKDFANIADPRTHVVVFLSPAEKHTEVHLIHSGWRSSANWEEARQWQEKAWRMALNNLEKFAIDKYSKK